MSNRQSQTLASLAERLGRQDEYRAVLRRIGAIGGEGKAVVADADADAVAVPSTAKLH